MSSPDVPKSPSPEGASFGKSPGSGPRRSPRFNPYDAAERQRCPASPMTQTTNRMDGLNMNNFEEVGASPGYVPPSGNAMRTFQRRAGKKIASVMKLPVGGSTPPSGSPSQSSSQISLPGSTVPTPQPSTSPSHVDEHRSSRPSKQAARVHAIDTDEEFWQLYTDLGTIGKGHFSKVKHIKDKSSGAEYAVKILSVDDDGNDLESIANEFEVLKAIQHVNVVPLYDAYATPGKLFMVMGLAGGGELMHRITKEDSVYSEQEARKHLFTIINTIKFLHDQGVVHRDLKPENVLLSSKDEDADILIADLGLARFFDKHEVLRTICGTHKYLAPELVRCDRGEIEGYDTAVDIWGVGLLMYIMLFGFNPFQRPSTRETHDAIMRCQYTFPKSTSVSREAKDLIARLLVLDHTRRLTSSQCLQHQWFQVFVSPKPLMTENKTVRERLSIFNAQRARQKVLGKSPHRRLGSQG